MRTTLRTAFSAATLTIVGAALAACGAASANAPQCAVGRVALDGVCVSEAVADYVACVRAQGAKLDADTSKRLSADAGYMSAKTDVALELSDKLQKEYATSDANVLEVIRGCNALRQSGGGPDACAGATSRLLECGYEAEASWLASCQTDKPYSACLAERMTSCDGLSVCGYERFSRAQCSGAPAATGIEGCESTLGCQSKCGDDLGCVCACNSKMASRVALAVGVTNQCYELHCAACGKRGSAECGACFQKSCGAVFDKLCRGK